MITPIIINVNPGQSYPAGGLSFTIDKTGTLYHIHTGRLVANGPWGIRLYRTIPNGNPELLWFGKDCNGSLTVINKKLYLGFNDNWKQKYFEVPGYIDPSDEPSSTIVNVNEAAMQTYKLQVANAQSQSNQASASASTAITISNANTNKITSLEQRLMALETKVQTMQSQILSRQQIEDIVWSKIWDVNYLIRLGFVKGSSSIREVQDYLVDLATYIRNITGK